MNPILKIYKNFRDKLIKLGVKLKQWNKNRKKKARSYKDKCKSILNWLEIKEDTLNLTDLEYWLRSIIKLRLQELIQVEESYWSQRGKHQWMKIEDKNTRFFHNYATIRKNKSMIAQLVDPSNNLEVIEHKPKANILFLFFRDLIGKAPPPCLMDSNIDLTRIYRRKETDLYFLDEDFRIEEFDEVVKCWKNNKTSGPDGYNGEFFKRFWPLLRSEIYQQNKILTQDNMLKRSVVSLCHETQTESVAHLLVEFCFAHQAWDLAKSGFNLEHRLPSSTQDMVESLISTGIKVKHK